MNPQKRAFPSWSKTPIERKAVILKIADIIEANSSELAQLLTEEQGKPLDSSTTEVFGMAAFCRYFTSLDLPVEVLEDSEGRKVESHRNPLGVVGAIVPNFPLMLMAFKLPPALIAGNTIVLKPAPTTPLSSLRFAELIADVVPAGVVNFVTDIMIWQSGLDRAPRCEEKFLSLDPLRRAQKSWLELPDC